MVNSKFIKNEVTELKRKIRCESMIYLCWVEFLLGSDHLLHLLSKRHFIRKVIERKN